MLPEEKKSRRVAIFWNGGRNGHASFLLGMAYSPDKSYTKQFGSRFTIYLGLWVINFIGKPKNIKE